MPIHMGVGFSCQAEVTQAGREAAEQAIAHLAGRRPDLWLVYGAMRFADPRVLRAIRSLSLGTPLVGCTDAGGLVTSGPQRNGLVVVGLVGEGVRFLTGIAHPIHGESRRAGDMLAQTLKAFRPVDPRAILLFPDGLTSNNPDILRGLQKVFGDQLPVAGGCAADDFHFQKTFQFYNDEVYNDSVPGVLIAGEIRIGMGIRHGWLPVGRPRKITQSTGQIIHTLDRKPAVSIYEDFLGLTRAELRDEPIARVAITYPLGTPPEGRGEYLLRGVMRVGRGGSLVCSGDMKPGTTVQLMIGGYEAALEAAQQAAHEALKDLGRAKLQGALVFSSVARQKMLGSEFQGEIDVVRDALGGAGVRLGGFYTYGEYGGRMFHNESVVVMAMGS